MFFIPEIIATLMNIDNNIDYKLYPKKNCPQIPVIIFF